MKPNIVIIIADNQSPWTLGCYGNEEILTPNIDHLAAEGVRFTNAFGFRYSAIGSPCRRGIPGVFITPKRSGKAGSTEKAGTIWTRLRTMPLILYDMREAPSSSMSDTTDHMGWIRICERDTGIGTRPITRTKSSSAFRARRYIRTDPPDGSSFNDIPTALMNSMTWWMIQGNVKT